MSRLTLPILALALVFALALPGCSTNPATGKAQFNILSESQEVSLGAEAAPDFIQGNGGEIPSASIRAYVSDLGMKLAKASERPDLPWEFFVLDSDQINAFALPGGKVFMSRGLMAKMDNEAQLAGVLGHEVGHVTAQHIGQQMSRTMAIQLGLIGVGVAGAVSDEAWMQVLGVGTSVGGTVYLLKFGRDQESQADELGVRYMTRLGYNPIAQVQVMQILKEASGGGGGQMEMLSTHPLPQTRIERLRELIRDKYPDYKQTGKYVFGEDRFKTQVLDELAKLPPAKHPGAKQ